MLRNGIFIGLVILCSWLLADNYTMDELIEEGLERSADLKIELESNKIESSYLRSSIFNLIPEVSFDAYKSQQNRGDWIKSSGLLINATYYFDLPKMFNIYQSILAKKNANLSLEYMNKFVAYSVFIQYTQILENQKSLEIQAGNYILQQKIYNQISVQYETGEKSLLDLQQSEITLIDYEIAKLETENNLEKLRKNLFQFLDLNDEGYDFLEPELNEAELIFNFQYSTALKQKRNVMRSNYSDTWQKRLNYLPTFYVGYNYTFANTTDLEFDDFDNYDIDRKTLTVGASLSLTGLLETNEQHLRSWHNYKKSKIDFLNSKTGLENELGNLENDYITLKKAKELYSKKLELAAKNLEMAQQQYRVGMISLLDMDRSQLEYSQAQLSYNNRYFELMRKREEVNLLLSERILGKW